MTVTKIKSQLTYYTNLWFSPAPAVEYAFRTFARSWRKSEPEPIADEQELEEPARFERLVWQALAEES